MTVHDELHKAGNALLRLAQLLYERQQRLSDSRSERTIASVLDKRGNCSSSRLPLLHDNPELGQVNPQRIHYHRVLAHEELSRPVKYQDSLLFLCDVAQASMPIKVGRSFAKNVRNSLRRKRLLIITFPAASTP